MGGPSREPTRVPDENARGVFGTIVLLIGCAILFVAAVSVANVVFDLRLVQEPDVIEISVETLYAGYFQRVFRAAVASTRGDEAQYKDFVRKIYKGSWVADGWLEQTEAGVKKGGPSVRTR